MNVALSFPECHRRGGVERVVYECARFLASRKHVVHLIADGYDPIPGSDIQFHPVKISRKPAFLHGKRYFQAATELLPSLPHDVLSTHGVVCPVGGLHWVQSLHAAWLDRAKTMRHALSLSRLKQRLNPVHPILLKLEAEHFRRRQYCRLITTTPQVASDLERYYGVPAKDIVIIPNGFNPDEFNPARRASRRAEMRQSIGLSQNHIAILFVANELQRKGFYVLLDALREIANPDVRLLVIGRPPVIQVKDAARAAGLESQVLALGSSSDVAGMHSAADLFVLPTQYEAFSLAILESLGSGLPVLTTSVPGASDAIRTGLNGAIQQNPLDASELASVLRPLLSHDRLAALSATTPQTVEAFQWPRVLQRYESLLQEYVVSKHQALSLT